MTDPWAEDDERPLRCYDCRWCTRGRAIWCNDPPGYCHPGPCEPETDEWGQPVA